MMRLVIIALSRVSAKASQGFASSRPASARRVVCSTWLSSTEAKNATGRVFDEQTPVITLPGDPQLAQEAQDTWELLRIADHEQVPGRDGNAIPSRGGGVFAARVGGGAPGDCFAEMAASANVARPSSSYAWLSSRFV